jgi:hypothetical protein
VRWNVQIRRGSLPAPTLLIASTVLAIACASRVGRSAPKPIRTSICAVVAHPEGFHNKTVAVHGWLSSDGREHTVIVDKACRERGFALLIPAGKQTDADVMLLWDAVYAGQPGTIDKEIQALFVGTFLWSPTRVPSRTLTLQAVSDLRTSKK